MPGKSNQLARRMPQDMASSPDRVLDMVLALGQRLELVEAAVTRIEGALGEVPVKEVYTTVELAEAVGRSVYTVTQRWCNAGRIRCQKDPESGRWLIPRDEYLRLTRGGGLLP